MKLYAVCWQDDCEPWGWEPAQGEGGPPQTFFWDEGEADRALAEHIDRMVPDMRERERRFWGENRPAMSTERARMTLESVWSVQVYDVPPPPT